MSASHRLLNAAGKNTIGCNGSLDINMSYKAICTERRCRSERGRHGKKARVHPRCNSISPLRFLMSAGGRKSPSVVRVPMPNEVREQAGGSKEIAIGQAGKSDQQ